MKVKIAFLFSLFAMLLSATVTAQQINEMRVASPGATDDVSNFFELFAAPGTSLNGLTFLAISSEFDPGLVTDAISLDGSSIGADGFFLASADNTFYGNETDLATGVDFFNSPQTFLLVDGFAGAVGDDLDVGNDGVIDSPSVFQSILDGVAIGDTDADDDTFYTTDVLTSPNINVPAHYFRIPDGGPWFFLDDGFVDTSQDTPGFSNVPEPA